MMVASVSLKAQGVTITLNPGWNWISYPLTTQMGIDEALSGITPVAGDQIKSKTAISVWDEVEEEWSGTLTTMTPGLGYMYYSARSGVVEFVFGQSASNSVVTDTPSGITTTGATVGGTVSIGESNHVFARGVCWGTEALPDVDGIHTTEAAEAGSHSVTLEGLTPGTTYYVRAYMVTDYGLSYGEALSFTTEEDGGGHAYVDLGLPSGLLWATCNVGAYTPEDCGDYFAWGETQPKAVYDWSTYQYCNGSHKTLTKYCNNTSYGNGGYTDDLTTLLPDDDAATANWGEGWRMPTKAEWQELYTNTTCTWTMQNGVYGRLFTATNGNSIFLPAAGYRSGGSLSDVGSYGNYWSGSLYTDNARSAWYLNYDAGYCAMDYYYSRSNGQTVRPVHEGEAPEPISFTGTVMDFEAKSGSWSWYKMFYSPYTQPESNDRTWVSFRNNLAWSVGDSIKVFDANAAHYDFTVSALSGTGNDLDQHATFEVTEPEKIYFLKDLETPASYAAFYPNAEFDAADNTVSMTIPSTQYYDFEAGHGGSFTTNTYPMFGVNDEANHFQFHSHAGILEFQFGCEEGRIVRVKEIVITADDPLVGTMTYPFDYPFNTYDPNADAYTLSNTSNQVVFDCGEGVTLPGADGYGFPVFVRFDIALHRGALANGFHVTVIGDKNNPMNLEEMIYNVILLDEDVLGSEYYNNNTIEAEEITVMMPRFIPVPGQG